MSEPDRAVEGAGALTGVNWLTRVNQAVRCARKIERTRTVGFKLPEPLHNAYTELPSSGKSVVKMVTASIIYALAKRYNIEVECEDQLKPLLSDVPAPGGQIIINANIAEAKPQVNVNIQVVNEIKDLVEYLYRLRHDFPEVQRRTVEKLYRLVQRLN